MKSLLHVKDGEGIGFSHKPLVVEDEEESSLDYLSSSRDYSEREGDDDDDDDDDSDFPSEIAPEGSERASDSSSASVSIIGSVSSGFSHRSSRSMSELSSVESVIDHSSRKEESEAATQSFSKAEHQTSSGLLDLESSDSSPMPKRRRRNDDQHSDEAIAKNGEEPSDDLSQILDSSFAARLEPANKAEDDNAMLRATTSGNPTSDVDSGDDISLVSQTSTPLIQSASSLDCSLPHTLSPPPTNPPPPPTSPPTNPPQPPTSPLSSSKESSK